MEDDRSSTSYPTTQTPHLAVPQRRDLQPAPRAKALYVEHGYPHRPDTMTFEPRSMGTNLGSVTVVIATRDRPELVRGALAAASGALRAGDSLILVDSASSEPKIMKEVAAEAGATLIRCEEPGTSRARNLGWRAASTDLVAFTDDDCLPDPHWLETALEMFETEPSAGFVTGSVVSDTSETLRAWLTLSVTSRTAPARFNFGDDPTDVGHGANMIWRRSALEQIGGFDEALGPGTRLRAAEDVDAFWRLLMSGAPGMFNPDSVVAHRQWRPRTKQLSVYLGYGVGSGALSVKRWLLQRADCRRLPWSAVAIMVGSEALWRHGIQGVLRCIVDRSVMGVLAQLAMLVGTLQGIVRARRMELVDGRLVPRE